MKKIATLVVERIGQYDGHTGKVTVQYLTQKSPGGVYYMNRKPMRGRSVPKVGDHIYSMNMKGKYMVLEVLNPSITKSEIIL